MTTASSPPSATPETSARDAAAAAHAASPTLPLPPDTGDHWRHSAVLVVDDEPGMCNFLLKTLAPRVGQVLAAGSAEAAEKLLQQTPF